MRSLDILVRVWNGRDEMSRWSIFQSGRKLPLILIWEDSTRKTKHNSIEIEAVTFRPDPKIESAIFVTFVCPNLFSLIARPLPPPSPTALRYANFTYARSTNDNQEYKQAPKRDPYARSIWKPVSAPLPLLRLLGDRLWLPARVKLGSPLPLYRTPSYGPKICQ